MEGNACQIFALAWFIVITFVSDNFVSSSLIVGGIYKAQLDV